MNAPLQTLAALFEAHGIPTCEETGALFFSEYPDFRAEAEIFRESQVSDGHSLQLDIRFDLAPGRQIIESFAGLGITPEDALQDAFQNFARCSLPVLLAALFNHSHPSVVVEEWQIGGEKRHIVIGDLTIKTLHPKSDLETLQSTLNTLWATQVEPQIKHLVLGPETHWVRVYFAQNHGKHVVLEVLRNNQDWDELKTPLTSLAWPLHQDFYSCRIFFMVLGAKGHHTTPESCAVTKLVEIVNESHSAEFDETRILEKMVDAGIPGRQAERALRFTQVAWGRLLLASLQITFSPIYLYFDANGNLVESDQVETEPFYSVAYTLAPRYLSTPAFKQLAASSADVQAVNQALHQGVEVRGGRMGPSFLFLEQPNEEGWRRAQQASEQHLVATWNKIPSGGQR